MRNNNQTIFQPGDLVTLKGMKKIKEKPIGMIKRKWATNDVEIFWINEDIAKRYAVKKIIDLKKLEIISKANQ
jgi:hypothetical protein